MTRYQQREQERTTTSRDIYLAGNGEKKDKENATERGNMEDNTTFKHPEHDRIDLEKDSPYNREDNTTNQQG